VETYHQFGIAVPRAVAAGELTRLSAVIDRMRPERVLILGDLLHSRIAVTDAFVDEVSRWRAAFPGAVHVVPGNHDRALPRVAGAWNMTVLSELHTEDGVEFAHAPCEDPAAFRWCGHLHPAVALGSRADRIRVPCFALTCNICVLPAFSGMAAGTGRGLPAKCRVFAAAETGVFEIPPRAEGVHRRGR
jgi:DNA ligase-associated metallophosphoesterase